MDYGFSKKINLNFEDAIAKVTEELKNEGFGVLTTIEVHKTLKAKLNVDFKKYTILGACNPPLVYKALKEEDLLGLLLPCNVVVSEDNESVKVSFFDPEIMGTLIDNDEIKVVAKEVKQKLQNVFIKL